MRSKYPGKVRNKSDRSSTISFCKYTLIVKVHILISVNNFCNKLKEVRVCLKFISMLDSYYIA